VGSLEQVYKAPDVLIDAVADAVNLGVDLQLTLVGDGKLRTELEQRAVARGVTERVRFVGHVSSSECLRQELDSADLFVLPSRTEGLPRAMIEAMARGLPCIGSNVGGIPELIAASERVPAGDPDALAKKLIEVLADPTRLARLSVENLEKARRYHPDALKPRRQAFYQAVRTATVQWQRNAIAPSLACRADNPVGEHDRVVNR
jgi:glycosyltransferase involved in cell wall biosynthesis